MPEPLRIGISTRALFNLEAEHEIFEEQGWRPYAEYQLKHEKDEIERGTGFEVISRLLALNKDQSTPLVEVILLSKNSPDLSLRAFNSISNYGIDIRLGSFTSGRSLAPFVPAWGIDLFLSNDENDVKSVALAGSASARLGIPPEKFDDPNEDEVRIAFDGDAVVFSAESDEIYKRQGLQAFLDNERSLAGDPMSDGPFAKFLRKLSVIRTIFFNEELGSSRIRISIVTARNAPAHERVVQTLRAWGTPADEAHFVGYREKAPILKASRAHIFFDDQEKHVLGASRIVAAGHVPGPHSPTMPIIPAYPAGVSQG